MVWSPFPNNDCVSGVGTREQQADEEGNMTRNESFRPTPSEYGRASNVEQISKLGLTESQTLESTREL